MTTTVSCSTPPAGFWRRPAANFFAVQSGVLLTAGSGVLEGITRKTVLRLASGIGLRTRLEAPALADRWQFEGAFLTSARRGACPSSRLPG